MGCRRLLACALPLVAAACAAQYGAEPFEPDGGDSSLPEASRPEPGQDSGDADVPDDPPDSGITDSGVTDTGVPDSQTPSAPASCKDLKASAPTTPTGVATITVAGAKVPVYCDMTTSGGGWTLVFRLSAGVAGEPYTLYTGPALNDTIATEATPRATQKHYVSRLLGRWNSGFTASEALIRLVSSTGAPLAELLFDAKDTGRETYFTRARLKRSPWTDLGNPEHFSLAGYGNLGRRFYIHKTWTTCEEDEGWLVVQGPTPAQCANYEISSNNIRIMYARGATARRWSTGIDEARSFTVFAR